MQSKFTALTLVALSAAGSLAFAQDKVDKLDKNARPTKTLQRFHLVPIQEAKVSANKPGAIVELPAQDGQTVEKDDILGQIDDRESQANVKAAKSELAVAEKQASSDAPVQAAEATEQVAQKEYEKSKAINEAKQNAVNVIELERLRLTWIKSGFQIAVAQQELDVAKLSVGVKDAQREVAELDVELRKIRAPFAGEIVQVHRHVGEWVQAGDPVLHLVQMDRLRVQGYLNTRHDSGAAASQNKDYPDEPIAVDLSEIIGRDCEVLVKLPKGKTTTFKSRVGFVSPVTEVNGDTRVWIEIENRKENGRWIAQPGLMADVKILLDPPAKPKPDAKPIAAKPEAKPNP